MALRYCVGIDLGTSNSALAYADLNARDPGAAVSVFEVPQLVGPGDLAPRPLLPSHLYLPGPHELPEGALALPWDGAHRGLAVGGFARDQGARVPGRHVASAKSWLCHPAVDRTAAILPWGAPPEVGRISPVEASARILEHLRRAWDAAHPQAPLAEQDVVITVPASFDEGARALTLRAAAEAGLPRPALLEEPQAAFYDFTRVHRGALAQELAGVRLVLVCDIGGGTTDFTLIAVEGSGEEPVLRRLAVGDHLLLGGDNMDIALARRAESDLRVKLGAGQWGALVQACRTAKERLLAADAPDWTAITVPGQGSQLVGGARTAQLAREAAREQTRGGVVPRGAREAVEQEVQGRTFGLTLGRPVRFRLFASSGYRPEKAGDLVPLDDDLAELPPLQSVVQGEGMAEVRLHSLLTEIGTLELSCVADPDRRESGAAARIDGARWELEFQLRQAGAVEDRGGSVSALPRGIEPAREAVQLVYGKKPQPVAGREVKDLWRNLEKALGDRAGWTLAVNRDLWGVLWAGAQKRRRSPDHERLFLQLCGFALRPGFGAPLDAWRCEQTFTLFPQGVTHHKEAAVWAAWWILWRRIAAGLGEAEHAAIFGAIEPHLRPTPKGRVANPGKKAPGLAIDEMVRLLGALERLAPSAKLEAGSWLVERLRTGAAPGTAWALGRLGARVPLAGAAHQAVPPEVAAQWLELLLGLDLRINTEAPFAIAQLARLSVDRARDLDEDLRTRAAAALEQARAPAEWARGIREVRELGEKDEQRVFGEALPLGLHLA